MPKAGDYNGLRLGFLYALTRGMLLPCIVGFGLAVSSMRSSQASGDGGFDVGIRLMQGGLAGYVLMLGLVRGIESRLIPAPCLEIAPRPPG